MKTHLLIISLFILTGCAGSKANLFFQSIFSPTSYEIIELEDKTTSLYYRIEKGNDPNTIIFFIPGSGHTSLQYYLSDYFKEFDANVEIYSLQKRAVSNRATGMFSKPDDFDKENIFENWVSDNLVFIRNILSVKLDNDKNIILFGVSEGATVVAKLATLIPEVTHLVVLGGGGYEQSKELEISFAEYQINFENVYQEIKKSPEEIKKTFLGHPYRYWSHILFVNPMEFYSKIQIPILLAIGKKDENIPVESARFLQKEFDRLKKTNFKYIEYENCNHVLIDSNQKSHRKDFFEEIINWSKIND